MSLDPTAERVLEAIDQIALTNGGMLNRRGGSTLRYVQIKTTRI